MGRLLQLVRIVLLLLVAGCAVLPAPQPDDGRYAAYLPPDEASLLSRFAPIFVTASPRRHYNRIGRPAVRLAADSEKEEIFVDPNEAVIYAESRDFADGKAEFTNLIYRIHFPAVPQPHLTAGDNVGLLVIVTLDRDQQPLLVTTVHTCGCYLVFTPTSLFPRSYWPPSLGGMSSQQAWGELLPAQLDYPSGTGGRLLVFLRDDTHRVMDLHFAAPDAIGHFDAVLPIKVESVAGLYALPRPNGRATSFFEERGWRKGFVKGSQKPWETVLMGWWALDLNVGSDKEYGTADSSTVFYTSLKPWNRNASDMRDFAAFLHFWGWRLPSR